jgi:hypothetical protein
MSRQDNRVGKPGEFRGDFTRDTFHAEDQYSRVFMQQGRVSIDADWNEQVSITNHYQRMLTTAMIGPHAAPWNCHTHFHLALTDDRQYRVNGGYYYVNGLMCLNKRTYEGDLADILKCDDHDLELGSFIFYLDVWESHVTYIDDDGIREQALGGADTATRAKINWKIRAKQIGEFDEIKPFLYFDETGQATGIDQDGFLRLIREDAKPGNAFMVAQGKSARKDSDLCSSDPNVGYRGKENQLYRVEICRSDEEMVTFKWSRENSAVMFPIREISNETVTLEHLGRDICTCLKVNDWVEVITGDEDCHCDKCVLHQVVSIDAEKYTVTLNHNVVGDFDDTALANAYLRRWDHGDGDENGIPVTEAAEDWYELEDGVEIQFGVALSILPQREISEKVREEELADMREREKPGHDSVKPLLKELYLGFQPGDYWLIPARSASNSIEWPTREDGKPSPLPPHGVVHHYAPLRLLLRDDGEEKMNFDTRRVISQNWQPVRQFSLVDVSLGKDDSNDGSLPGGAAKPAATRKKAIAKKVKKKTTKKR